jgi:hypothetical protein
MIGQLKVHVPAAGGEVLQQQGKRTYLLLVVKYCSSKGNCRTTITVKEANSCKGTTREDDPMKMIRLPIILVGSRKSEVDHFYAPTRL